LRSKKGIGTLLYARIVGHCISDKVCHAYVKVLGRQTSTWMRKPKCANLGRYDWIDAQKMDAL